MKSINKDNINEIIINKSKFIGILCHINSKEEAKEKIEYYKSNYKNATHYCYAYIINGYNKCSDDGEPSGTAGLPMLNVLEKKELDYILCIVIRYFGGIKLGAGGLVRAYSNAVREVINNSEIITLINGYKVTIEFNYENTKIIDNALKDINIKKEFNEKINFTFNITAEKYNEIENILQTHSNIIKKEKTLV